MLAQKSDKDVSFQTVLSIVLMSLRWLFSASLAMIAIQWTLEDDTRVLDPEQVMPVAISTLPNGPRGIVVAALVAAGEFMAWIVQ